MTSGPSSARLLTRGAKIFGKVVSISAANVHRLGWAPGDDEVELIRDIPYTRRGGKQSVDLYLPKNRDRARPLPFAFYMHGGGWVIGDRKMGTLMGRHLASRGIAVVAPGYRLVPSASLDEQLEDIKQALQFILDSAGRYGLESERYALIGESAGAHLAMRLLQRFPGGPRPRAAVGFYGPYDLEIYRRAKSPWMKAFFRTIAQGTDLDVVVKSHGALCELPWTNMPVLLVHGSADRFVPVQNSIRMKELLERQGVPVTLTIYPGSGHGFNYQTRVNPQHTLDSYRELVRFFHQHVRTGSST
ncbi:MAG TPA: alpha/beta hydrolase [Polyangiaceae bacterium]